MAVTVQVAVVPEKAVVTAVEVEVGGRVRFNFETSTSCNDPLFVM